MQQRQRGSRGSVDVTAAGRAAGHPLVTAALVALTLALAFASHRAGAATYKWVDEKGAVHYTDQIPPEAMNKGNVVLDKQGVQIKKNDPPPTAEQRKAKADEEARQVQLAKDRELVDRRDRALLSTYTVEGEIDLARKRALSTIDAQVQSSTAYSATLSKRKSELDEKKTALGDKPVPLVLERELANINTELQKQNELVAARQRDIVAVNARYDADKKRWKELRAATEAQVNGTPRPATPPAPAPAPTTAAK